MGISPFDQVSARNSSYRRHYRFDPVIGPQPLEHQSLHQSRAYRLISLSSSERTRCRDEDRRCATRTGQSRRSCAQEPPTRAAARTVKLKLRSLAVGYHDLGIWFHRYASPDLECFDLRLATARNPMLDNLRKPASGPKAKKTACVDL